MTDEAKALVKWLRSMRSPHTGPAADLIETQAREIEQHEAFRQEVSDAVELAIEDCRHDGLIKAYIHGRFSRFTTPKPDPLVEALNAVNPDVSHGEGDTELFRAALAKRGLQVTEIER